METSIWSKTFFKIDRVETQIIHILGLNHLTQIKQTNNLIDIWRKENPDKRLFTYHNKNQLIHSRIDRIYIHDKQKIKNVSIIPNSHSDHDAAKLTMQILKIKYIWYRILETKYIYFETKILSKFI